MIHVQNGRTALYFASWKGHGAVGQLLLRQHADVNICKKVYTLFDFCQIDQYMSNTAHHCEYTSNIAHMNTALDVTLIYCQHRMV